MAKPQTKISLITPSNFKPFGLLIDYPRRPKTKKGNLFRIVIRQTKPGWRIAYLVVRDKVIDKLEQHPDSLETFEPQKGRGLLYVAKEKDRRNIKRFLLDKPVILKKGIWHGIVSLSKECEIKIVENAKVRCVYWPLTMKII